MLSTPIVFIIYNRPNQTLRVFDMIRKVQPQQLFIIADGAKNENDLKKVIETRKITENIDWNCTIKTNFSENNMGCAKRIITGLNWVFENVDKAIILEDDCLPNLSFFNYCEELLNYYEKDTDVMHISGFNIMGSCEINSSYFFSKHLLPPWGWATWKRSWEFHNPNLDTWQQIKTWAYQNISQEFFKDWTDMFENVRINQTTWDVSWNTDLWKNNGLCIIPKKNLVQNIGFGEDATFTKNTNSKLAEIQAQFCTQPMSHPVIKSTNFDFLIEKILVESLRINAI